MVEAVKVTEVPVVMLLPGLEAIVIEGITNGFTVYAVVEVMKSEPLTIVIKPAVALAGKTAVIVVELTIVKLVALTPLNLTAVICDNLDS